MLKIFAKSIFSFMTATLLLSVIHIGCSARHLDQNQQNILEQPQENIGPVTDFQVSGYQLYIVTANGFFILTADGFFILSKSLPLTTHRRDIYTPIFSYGCIFLTGSVV